MNYEAFNRERTTILSALERDFNAAKARVEAAAAAELGRLKASFSTAKAALEASARKNEIGALRPTDGMGDVAGVKFEINLVGQTWRHTR